MLLHERLTTAQDQRFLIHENLRRTRRKRQVDKTAAAILSQSYLDRLAGKVKRKV